MERHIGKRLGIPCAVISAPVHVQDFPARYSPQMGPEGANVIFDTWVHPLVMGLEEHLLTMFREDFEFHDEAGPSHHAAHSPGQKNEPQVVEAADSTAENRIIWLKDAEKELKKTNKAEMLDMDKEDKNLYGPVTIKNENGSSTSILLNDIEYPKKINETLFSISLEINKRKNQN